MPFLDCATSRSCFSNAKFSCVFHASNRFPPLPNYPRRTKTNPSGLGRTGRVGRREFSYAPRRGVPYCQKGRSLTAASVAGIVRLRRFWTLGRLLPLLLVLL